MTVRSTLEPGYKCITKSLAHSVLVVFIISSLIPGRIMLGEDGGETSTFPSSTHPFYARYLHMQFASGSAFERNLNTVLEDLVQNTSQTGFNTSSYGQSLNKAYGTLECRGDLSQQMMLGEDGGETGTFPSSTQPFSARYLHMQFARGSAFESNLNTVLKDLVQNTSQTGFNTSSYGRSPNKAYGTLQCRGDLSQQQCLNCSQNAIALINSTLGGACNNSLRCELWLEFCSLRYANYSVVPELVLTEYIKTEYSNSVGNSSSPLTFAVSLQTLLNNLTAEASKPTNKGFAAGSVNYSNISSSSGDESVDALVECSRDLSSSNCTACLSAGIKLLAPYRNLRANVMLRRCSLQYNSTETAQDIINSAQNPSTSPTNDDNSSSEKLVNNLSWGIVGGLLASLLAV